MLFNYQKMHSPLGRTPTLDEVGGAALYLLSDLSTAVTGEVHYVDSGYNIVAMPQPETINEAGEGMAVQARNGNGNGKSNGNTDEAALKRPQAAE